MSGEKPARTSMVGIIYLIAGKLWIDATPVARAMHFGDYVIHEREHRQYWRQLVKQRAAPDTGYEEYPRCRVSHDEKSGRFRLLADACILRDKKLVTAILLRMHLPTRGTETGTDSLYRCSDCQRRNP